MILTHICNKFPSFSITLIGFPFQQKREGKDWTHLPKWISRGKWSLNLETIKFYSVKQLKDFSFSRILFNKKIIFHFSFRTLIICWAMRMRWWKWNFCIEAKRLRRWKNKNGKRTSRQESQNLCICLATFYDRNVFYSSTICFLEKSKERNLSW